MNNNTSLLTPSVSDVPSPNDRGTPAPAGWWASRPGRIRPMILLWALGVPIPIILIIFLIRGCTG